MTYQPTRDFDTSSPAALRRDLQQLDRAIEAAFRLLVVPLWSTRRTVTADTTAKFGELLLVDATNGNVDITLPRASSVGSAGGIRTFGLVLSTASNVVTLRCVGADTINRGSTYQVQATTGFAGTVIFDGTEYWYPTRPTE